MLTTLTGPAARRTSSLLHRFAAACERRVFTTAMNLPPAVQRRLAGRPLDIDGHRLAVDAQLMLRLSALSGPDVWSQPVPHARSGLLRQCRLVGGEQPIGEVRELETTAGRGRLYVPVSATETGPLLVFLHGGGFALGDLDSHDAPCRFLAEESGVRILSVEYRLAPEHPFPAAYEDAIAGFDWAVAHAAELGADPARVGVGGDSSGGNLAAEVALARPGVCAFQLLIYPVTQMAEVTKSRELFAHGLFLTGDAIETCGGYYVQGDADPRDPRLAPMSAEIPADLPPAYVATAGFDPLRDEGEAYADRLREAGVEVTLRRFEDQIHGFLNVVGSGRTALAATREVAAALEALSR